MYMARMGHCGNRESETSKVGMLRPRGLRQDRLLARFALRQRARHGGGEAVCTSVTLRIQFVCID